MKITEKGEEGTDNAQCLQSRVSSMPNCCPTVNDRLEGENDQGTGIRPHSDFDT